jgi:hypothetical protein
MFTHAADVTVTKVVAADAAAEAALIQRASAAADAINIPFLRVKG